MLTMVKSSGHTSIRMAVIFLLCSKSFLLLDKSSCHAMTLFLSHDKFIFVMPPVFFVV